MIYIFPIGGKGKRTQKLFKWKPFIKINSKYIFEYALEDINFTEKDTIIFISAKSVIPEWGEKVLTSKLSKLKIKKFEIVILDEVQPGPALTVYNGLKKINVNNNENIHIINVDQSIKYESFELSKPSGIMPIWFNSKSNSCYVKISDKEPIITEIKEKEMISFYASSGVYIFSSLYILNKSIEWGINNPSVWKQSKGYDYQELFIGPCMTYLIQRKDSILWASSTYKKIDLGSLKEIENHKQF